MENVKSRRLRYVRRMKKEKADVQNIHINTEKELEETSNVAEEMK